MLGKKETANYRICVKLQYGVKISHSWKSHAHENPFPCMKEISSFLSCMPSGLREDKGLLSLLLPLSSWWIPSMEITFPVRADLKCLLSRVLRQFAPSQMDHHKTLKRSLVRALFQAPVHDYNLHFFKHAVATKPLHHPTPNSRFFWSYTCFGLTHQFNLKYRDLWNDCSARRSSTMSGIYNRSAYPSFSALPGVRSSPWLARESRQVSAEHPKSQFLLIAETMCWWWRQILLLTQITVGTVYSFQHERSCHL